MEQHYLEMFMGIKNPASFFEIVGEFGKVSSDFCTKRITSLEGRIDQYFISLMKCGTTEGHTLIIFNEDNNDQKELILDFDC